MISVRADTSQEPTIADLDPGKTYLSEFLDATTHLYKRSFPSVGPSVRPSVRRSVPCYFRKAKIMDFDDEKSSYDVIDNSTMSDDEVVASYGPPWSCFFKSVFFLKKKKSVVN